MITLFPTAFPGVLGESLTGKALHDGLWQLETVDLRRYGEGKHRNVDDTPAGGGAGMVLRADVVGRAIDDTQKTAKGRWPIIYLSPRGAPMTQALMQDLAAADGVTLLCGRFEGVDERVIEHYNIQEVSLGDFVLTGGEIAAQALIDATVRLLPGVLGNQASTEEEKLFQRIAGASTIYPPRHLERARDTGHSDIGGSCQGGRMAARYVEKADTGA